MRAGVTYRFEDEVGRYEAALREVGIEPVRIAPFDARTLDSLDVANDLVRKVAPTY